ncbi:rho guanine nucleotide exchange factor 39 [Cylas formicarius]|uniref:rho guanine nucleotide exchange factor 39 n=1 Tax=Cylas formicarius TaxID=197179 RepID=UPI0029589312|nr:rho guanine nucleotide exchange factor 39 [Cylas formicarius]
MQTAKQRELAKELRVRLCEVNTSKTFSQRDNNDKKVPSELVINVNPLTPKQLNQHGIKVDSNNIPLTPVANIEFSLELKKVINERNILTSKTRKRVFEALDEIKTKTEEETRNLKRERALLEIVNSEIKYIHQLELIINYFMKPALERKLLRSDDFEILFGSIKTIYKINKELLEELDKGFDNVPTAFSRIAPFLKLYSMYAHGFKDKLRILQNSRSVNPMFAKFVENQESRPEVQNKLSALLITPIQRVPRYKLLLTNLYDLSTPNNANYEILGECLSKVEESAAHINKIVQDQENSQRLLELQRCLRSGEPNIITPGRRLKKEGILTKMCMKDAHNEKLYVVLMNDIILFNKMRKNELKVNSLKCSCIFPLNKCKVIEVLDKGCLKVVCQNEELILYHDELQEMIAWIQAINQAILSYLEDRKSLRKESSSRRAVKRKDINEYHEVGLSPGRPLKKRKMIMEQEVSPIDKPPSHIKISARRPIHMACNSTPIRLESNPETRNIHRFSPMETFGGSSKLAFEKCEEESEESKGVFQFGKKNEEENTTRVGNFFKGVGYTIRGLFGFKNNKS